MSRLPSNSYSLCSLLLMGALLSGCSKSGRAGGADPQRAAAEKTPPSPLAVGIAIASYAHAVGWIAKDRSFFAQQQLEAKVHVMGGSAATMRALIGGSIDVGLAGGDAVIKANAAGAKLVVIGGLVDRFYHRLVGRKGLAGIAALKGKRIGLPFLGGPQDMAVRYALKKAGLRYNEDVKILGLGREFNRMAALSRKEIDATTSQTPPAQLARMGLAVLMDLPREKVHFPYAVVVTRRQTLKQRRSLLKRFLHALCQAIAFYKDPKNRKPALDLIARRLGTNADTGGSSRQRYEQTGPSMLSFPPRPSADAFRMVLGFLGKRGQPALQPEALFELSLLEELLAAGQCGPAAKTPRPSSS